MKEEVRRRRERSKRVTATHTLNFNKHVHLGCIHTQLKMKLTYPQDSHKLW